MRWPLMLKKTHNTQVDQMLEAYQTIIDQEYARAMRDGWVKVHAWAVDANFNVFHHPNPRGAASAAFQEAERIFRPDPVTVKEVLEGAQ